MGLVFGALLSSILNTNYFPLAFLHIKNWTYPSTQTEVMWQVVKGALLGQVAVIN